MAATLNLVGPGRAGSFLAGALGGAGGFSVEGVASRSVEGRGRAATMFPEATIAPRLHALPSADAWLLAVPDDAVAPCAEELAGSGKLRHGDLVFHCSGALDSAALAACEAAGAMVASFHPAATIPAEASLLPDPAAVLFVIEGRDEPAAVLADAAARLGAAHVRIGAADKLLYHTACVLAANGVVALVEAAQRCFAASGLDGEASRRALQGLATPALRNALELGPSAALTGPVGRGDVETVRRELALLLGRDATAAQAYRALAVLALELALPRLDAESVERLRFILR